MIVAAAAASIWAGVYTPAQAARGRELYLQHCAAACHVENLQGNGPAPALAGKEFLLRWEDFSVAELLTKTRATMPKAAPASLGDAVYLDITAFILSVNGVPAGKTELGANLTAVMVPAKN
jgi:mono/diheme cytochrome c family protein